MFPVYSIPEGKEAMVYSISVESITKYLGKTLAVDHASFNVQEGIVFGLLGPNGAGKTTTIRMLTTVLKPDEGTAKIRGYDLVKDAVKVREVIGVLPEDTGLYDRLTPAEMLIFHGKIRGMDKKEILEKTEKYLSMLDLQANRDQKVGTFSKGMKQKLALIRAVFHEPEIIFLDEPTVGLDVMSARQIRKLISEESGHGTTVVLSTHNMWEAQQLCREVAVINKGKIVSQGTIEALEQLTHEKDLEDVFVHLVRGEVTE
ncbi:MAG: type transport system ATP-binding protein [Thermoproteota archaeon]|nr:type transport system ATP-binding protein [Thermoproteota archaeon]